MRLGWLTDIHLNFVGSDVRNTLYDHVCQRCDGVVITGDIGESDSVVRYLSEMARELARPIYFVLGNHDFYRGSIAKTRELVTQAASRSDYLHYLTVGGVIELTSKTALVGHDGWADGRLGDFTASEVILNDFLLIDELRMWRSNHDLDKDALRPVLQTLADEAVCQLRTNLAAAAAKHSRVIVATHVPPFREAAWYQGGLSDDDFLPFFASHATGEMLRQFAAAHPATQLQVLCGHTHGSGCVKIADNLEVLTGGAEYEAPELQQVFDVE